ncbi:MAG: YheV family putative zinc ribbon protein [Gammaproteobacteria bacterium]
MKKQFIAGAKCPQCGLEDKIYVYHQDGDDIAQCNACGYRSVRPKDNDPPSPPDDDGEAGIVRILQ